VKFSVMSYNVLAQELLENHPYLYRYHDPRSLHWPRRFSGLIEEISYLRPDVSFMTAMYRYFHCFISDF
jgi:protein angel